MINKEDAMPVSKQCKILSLPRSTFYYEPVPVSAEDVELMRQIDEIHLEIPYYGCRKIRRELKTRGYDIGRDRVRSLMRKMGITAIYCKPRLSMPDTAHKIYPYLLKDVVIIRANHVWCADITYIPMPKGFCYLVAVMDWASRMVLAWKLSNTMDSAFCVEALEEALTKYGRPEIFNTDQGSQFTSEDFTNVLKNHDIKISMDSKGRWMDNIFIERLWRSVKYEDIYLKAYGTMQELKTGLKNYFERYNTRRYHQTLDNETPAMVYFYTLPQEKAA